LTAEPDKAFENKFTGGMRGIDPTLYEALHQVARRERFRAGRPDTLQTTAVLHEAYVRLADKPAWQSREHFMAVASTTMRYVLVDAARARLSAKRGSGVAALPLDMAEAASDDDRLDAELVRLGDALHDLAGFDADLATLVDCRYFTGLTEEETARALGISDRTVRRRWSQARAWIYQAMAE